MNSIAPIHLSPPNNTILGGCNNHICGNFNAILGGSGNNISNFNYVGIYGCNVLAVRDEAFHANNYLIKDISPIYGSFCQLYYDAASFGLNIS